VKELYRITCEDDEGQRHCVVAWEKKRIFWWVSKGTTHRQSITLYQLEDGSAVHFVDDDTFEVVASGKTIRRCE